MMRKPVAFSERHFPEDERKSRHERDDRRSKVFFTAFAKTARRVFHFFGRLRETSSFNPIQRDVFSHFVIGNSWSFIFEVLIHERKVALLPSIPSEIVRVGNDFYTIILIRKVNIDTLIVTVGIDYLFTVRNPLKQTTRAIHIHLIREWL
jgi:hypothetical protein